MEKQYYWIKFKPWQRNLLQIYDHISTYFVILMLVLIVKNLYDITQLAIFLFNAFIGLLKIQYAKDLFSETKKYMPLSQIEFRYLSLLIGFGICVFMVFGLFGFLAAIAGHYGFYVLFALSLGAIVFSIYFFITIQKIEKDYEFRTEDDE